MVSDPTVTDRVGLYIGVFHLRTEPKPGVTVTIQHEGTTFKITGNSVFTGGRGDLRKTLKIHTEKYPSVKPIPFLGFHTVPGMLSSSTSGWGIPTVNGTMRLPPNDTRADYDLCPFTEKIDQEIAMEWLMLYDGGYAQGSFTLFPKPNATASIGDAQPPPLPIRIERMGFGDRNAGIRSIAGMGAGVISVLLAWAFLCV